MLYKVPTHNGSRSFAKHQLKSGIYKGWNFNSDKYLFTTETK